MYFAQNLQVFFFIFNITEFESVVTLSAHT